MPVFFAAWKYKRLAVSSVAGTFIFGIVADYFWPSLNNDFFVALFCFGASSFILSFVLSLEESLPPKDKPDKEGNTGGLDTLQKG